MFDVLSSIWPDLDSRASKTTPHRFSLSDDAAIETVLTEIPLFCVGIMAFGVFTFFLIQRRFSLLATYLFLSSAFGFGAGIFDLSQVLERGVNKMAEGTGTDTVTALLNTREIFLAISTGFRFIFMWEFAATRPRWDPLPRAADSIQALMNQPLIMLHSASWDRWGLTGYVLKWSTLGMSIVIPVLQIVWRITTDHPTAIYVAEGTLEITASSIFILKLLLNTAFAPPNQTGTAFLWYMVPLAAFFLFMTIGVINLIYFAFTETLLGRFLLAIGMYTLILYVLVFAFFNSPSRSRPGSIASTRRSNRDTELWGSANEKNPNPIIRQPSVIPYVAPPPPPRPSRNSTMSRIASYLSPRRPSRPQSLYSTASSMRFFDMDPERGGGGGGPPSSNSGSKLSDTVEVLSPHVSELKRDGQGPWGGSQYTADSAAPSPSTAASQSRMPMRPETSEVVIFPTISEKSSGEDVRGTSPDRDRNDSNSSSNATRPATEISLGSYYMPYTNSAAASSYLMPQMPAARPRTPESPIYGLEGLIDPRDRRVIPFTPMTMASSTAEPMTARGDLRMPSTDFSLSYSSRHGSGTSIDELLRQQNELDKSIAALRLFSPRSSFATTVQDNRPESGTVDPMPSGAPSDTNSVVVKVIPSRGTSTSDMSGKMTAASGESSFSLSVFPAPPPNGGVSASPSPLPSAVPRSPLLAQQQTYSEPKRSSLIVQAPLGVTSSPMALSPLPMGLSLSPMGGISPTLSNSASPTRGRTEDFPQSVTLQPPQPGGSALSSPTTPSSRGGRIQSGGTQYDVTSFIVPRSFEAASKLAGLASPVRESPMMPVLPNTPVTPQVMPSTPMTAGMPMPVTPSQPMPMSPVTPMPNSGRMQSEMTQFDVTSFIGNLTSPGNETTASPLQVNVERTAIPSQAFPSSVSSRPSTGEESIARGPTLPSNPSPTNRSRSPPRSNSLPEEGSTIGVIETAPSGPILRPLRLTSGGPPVTTAPPVEARPTRHVRISSVAKEVAPLKPLILGSGPGPGLPPRSAIKPTAHNRSNSFNMPPTSYAMPPGPRRQGSNNSLRPAKPLVISVPRPLAQDSVEDSGAYERPRAVPVISQEDIGPL
ncbi:hypothetical protein GGG16DRAFT_89289 [Schizophyllum commune]